MRILAAEIYVSPRERPLTERESFVRATAYALKVPDCRAVREAALAMEPLVPSRSALVPIPSSGGLDANRALALALAELTEGIVVPLLRRAVPVESSHQRRRRGERGLPAEVHAASFTRASALPSGRQIVFVDNVATSGATIEGAWRALGSPHGAIGVVYARGREVLVLPQSNPPAWLGKLASWTAVGAVSDMLLGPIQRAVAGGAERAVVAMNPDADLRDLERRAAMGDLQAAYQLKWALARTRPPCGSCGEVVMTPAVGLLPEPQEAGICFGCELSAVDSGLTHGMLWRCPCRRLALQGEPCDSCGQTEEGRDEEDLEDWTGESNPPPAGLRFRVLDRPREGFFVTAYLGRKMIGRVGAVETLHHYDVVTADVVEPLQGQGIGAAIYSAAADEACRRGKPLRSEGFQRSQQAGGAWEKLSRARHVERMLSKAGRIDYVAPCPPRDNPIRARFGADRDRVDVYGPAFPGSVAYWDAKFVDGGERGYLGATDLYDAKGRRWLDPKAPPARPAWTNPPMRCRKNCPACLAGVAAGAYGALRGRR